MQKNKRRGDGPNTLAEPEERDKVVRLTPFAVVPVSVGWGAFFCAWEVGGGEEVGRGGGEALKAAGAGAGVGLDPGLRQAPPSLPPQWIMPRAAAAAVAGGK